MEVFPAEDSAPNEVGVGPTVSQLEQMKAWDDSFTQLEKVLQAACETKDANNCSKQLEVTSPSGIDDEATANVKGDTKRKWEDDLLGAVDFNKSKLKRTNNMILSTGEVTIQLVGTVSDECEEKPVSKLIPNEVKDEKHPLIINPTIKSEIDHSSTQNSLEFIKIEPNETKDIKTLDFKNFAAENITITPIIKADDSPNKEECFTPTDMEFPLDFKPNISGGEECIEKKIDSICSDDVLTTITKTEDTEPKDESDINTKEELEDKPDISEPKKESIFADCPFEEKEEKLPCSESLDQGVSEDTSDKKKEKEKKEESDKNAKKDDKKKKKFERCNIRDIKLEDELDAVTLSAQKEEQERIRRLQEAQMRALQERLQQIEVEKEALTQLFSQPPDDAPNLFDSTSISSTDTSTEAEVKTEAVVKSENDVVLIESSDEDKKAKLQSLIPAPIEENIIDISSSSSGSDSDSDDSDKKDDDIMVLSDEGEAESSEGGAEDPNNSGAHTNDVFNQPDEEGRVLVNVGHPPEDPDIFLAPQIAKVIKPHQIGGIRFLYDNVVENLERYKSSSGFGCILAHSMGLGKTVQVVSFVDVFLRHTPATLVLCIVPINTIQNWKAEFDMWVPPSNCIDDSQVLSGEVRPRDYNVYTLNENFKTMAARASLIADWRKQGGVLLMGYEMYRMLALRKMPKIPVKKSKRLKKQEIGVEPETNDQIKKYMDEMYEHIVIPGPDLVICDEGHRIKNSLASTSMALKSIKTRRRVVLTGYPLQNNLLEYWCMVDFVRPNYLGSRAEFCNMFERPISNGQCIDSTPRDRQLMRFRSHVLHSLLVGFVQRRGHSVLRAVLPKKEEHVLLIRMTSIQRQLYKCFVKDLLYVQQATNPLKLFAVCCKIWNHPDILYKLLQEKKAQEDIDLDIDMTNLSSNSSNAGGNCMKKRALMGSKSKMQQRSIKALPKSMKTQMQSNLHLSPDSQLSVLPNQGIKSEQHCSDQHPVKSQLLDDLNFAKSSYENKDEYGTSEQMDFSTQQGPQQSFQSQYSSKMPSQYCQSNYQQQYQSTSQKKSLQFGQQNQQSQQQQFPSQSSILPQQYSQQSQNQYSQHETPTFSQSDSQVLQHFPIPTNSQQDQNLCPQSPDSQSSYQSSSSQQYSSQSSTQQHTPQNSSKKQYKNSSQQFANQSSSKLDGTFRSLSPSSQQALNRSFSSQATSQQFSQSGSQPFNSQTVTQQNYQQQSYQTSTKPQQYSEQQSSQKFSQTPGNISAMHTASQQPFSQMPNQQQQLPETSIPQFSAKSQFQRSPPHSQFPQNHSSQFPLPSPPLPGQQYQQTSPKQFSQQQSYSQLSPSPQFPQQASPQQSPSQSQFSQASPTSQKYSQLSQQPPEYPQQNTHQQYQQSTQQYSQQVMPSQYSQSGLPYTDHGVLQQYPEQSSHQQYSQQFQQSYNQTGQQYPQQSSPHSFPQQNFSQSAQYQKYQTKTQQNSFAQQAPAGNIQFSQSSSQSTSKQASVSPTQVSTGKPAKFNQQKQFSSQNSPESQYSQSMGQSQQYCHQPSQASQQFPQTSQATSQQVQSPAHFSQQLQKGPQYSQQTNASQSYTQSTQFNHQPANSSKSYVQPTTQVSFTQAGQYSQQATQNQQYASPSQSSQAFSQQTQTQLYSQQPNQASQFGQHQDLQTSQTFSQQLPQSAQFSQGVQPQNYPQQTVPPYSSQSSQSSQYTQQQPPPPQFLQQSASQYHQTTPSPQQFCQSITSSQQFPQQPTQTPQQFPQQSIPSPQQFPQQPTPSPQQFPQQPTPSPQQFPQQPTPSPQQFPQQPPPSPQQFPQQPTPSPQQFPQQTASPQQFTQQSTSSKYLQQSTSSQQFCQQPSQQFTQQPVPSPQQFSQQPVPSPQQFPQQPVPSPQQFPQQPVPSPQQFPQQPVPSPQQFPQQPVPSPQQFPQQPVPSPQQFPQQPTPSPQQFSQQSSPYTQQPAQSPQQFTQQPSSTQQFSQQPSSVVTQFPQQPTSSTQQYSQQPIPPQKYSQQPTQSSQQYQPPSPSPNQFSQQSSQVQQFSQQAAPSSQFSQQLTSQQFPQQASSSQYPQQSTSHQYKQQPMRNAPSTQHSNQQQCSTNVQSQQYQNAFAQPSTQPSLKTNFQPEFQGQKQTNIQGAQPDIQVQPTIPQLSNVKQTAHNKSKVRSKGICQPEIPNQSSSGKQAYSAFSNDSNNQLLPQRQVFQQPQNSTNQKLQTLSSTVTNQENFNLHHVKPESTDNYPSKCPKAILQPVKSQVSNDTASQSQVKNPELIAETEQNVSTASETSVVTFRDRMDSSINYEWAIPIMKDYVLGVLENSHKMMVLFVIISETLHVGDKLLVFSQSLSTLDLLEHFLSKIQVPVRPDQTENSTNETWCRNKNYFRLDGSTSAQEREKLINEFNRNDTVSLFLLSTRAGCLGINLVGANRIVVMDASWNPCHDAQAVCRIYRYGQKKQCHIYRLVTDNSLEKRIYDRQVNKQGMSDRVVDELNPESNFTWKDVTTLIQDDEDDGPVQELSKFSSSYSDRVLKYLVSEMSPSLSKEPFEHESLLLDRKDLKLTKQEKRLAKQSYEMAKRANMINIRTTYTYLPAGAGGTGGGQFIINNKPCQWVGGTTIRVLPNQSASSGGNVRSGTTATPITASPSLMSSLFKQGVMVQKLTMPSNVSIPVLTPGAPPVVIPAGQDVLVLRTPKGVYLRLPDGRIIAVQLPPSLLAKTQFRPNVVTHFRPATPKGSNQSPTVINTPRGQSIGIIKQTLQCGGTVRYSGPRPVQVGSTQNASRSSAPEVIDLSDDDEPTIRKSSGSNMSTNSSGSESGSGDQDQKQDLAAAAALLPGKQITIRKISPSAQMSSIQLPSSKEKCELPQMLTKNKQITIMPINPSSQQNRQKVAPQLAQPLRVQQMLLQPQQGKRKTPQKNTGKMHMTPLFSDKNIRPQITITPQTSIQQLNPSQKSNQSVTLLPQKNESAEHNGSQLVVTSTMKSCLTDNSSKLALEKNPPALPLLNQNELSVTPIPQNVPTTPQVSKPVPMSVTSLPSSASQSSQGAHQLSVTSLSSHNYDVCSDGNQQTMTTINAQTTQSQAAQPISSIHGQQMVNKLKSSKVDSSSQLVTSTMSNVQISHVQQHTKPPSSQAPSTVSQPISQLSHTSASQSGTVQHSPQSSNIQSSPQSSNIQPSPQPATIQHSPQPPNIQHSPQPANIQHSPQPSNIQHSPQPANIQHSPQSNLQQHLPQNSQDNQVQHQAPYSSPQISHSPNRIMSSVSLQPQTMSPNPHMIPSRKRKSANRQPSKKAPHSLLTTNQVLQSQTPEVSQQFLHSQVPDHLPESHFPAFSHHMQSPDFSNFTNFATHKSHIQHPQPLHPLQHSQDHSLPPHLQHMSHLYPMSPHIPGSSTSVSEMQPQAPRAWPVPQPPASSFHPFSQSSPYYSSGQENSQFPFKPSFPLPQSSVTPNLSLSDSSVVNVTGVDQSSRNCSSEL